jgi:RNA polymerase sigma-70 factor (ECF subfamily)
MEPSDAELIARVVERDDRHAFSTLVRRHQSLVRNVLRRLTAGDAALADDLAQETFLRAYRGLRRFRGGAKFSSWLYRIAYNVFLSKRAKAGAPEVAEAPEAGQDPSGDAVMRHDVDRAMAALRPEERLALTLAYWQGASHGEVAEVLGCPLGTAKSHITRGKETLRRQLKAWA